MPVETKAQNLVYQTQSVPSKAASPGRAGSTLPQLLNFYGSARIDKLFLNRFRFVLAHALFDSLWGSVDQVLGFFQSEAGHFAHGLNHINLVCARRGEDNRKLGL